MNINLFDRVALALAPRWGIRRLQAREAVKEFSAFRAASTGRLRSNWGLFRTEADAPQVERRILQQRARDAARNDPIASGALDTMRQNIVGTGLKPQSTLRAKVLGISEDRAKEIRQQVETAWEAFVPLADAANVLNFDEIQFLALSKIIEDGEVLAIPTWASEDWRAFGRCIEILPGSRLDSPKATGDNIRNGIKFGDRGQPLSYQIRKTNQKTGRESNEVATINARDKRGRPKILHLFNATQPGQTRGVPLFAPVLTYFKDLADFLEAEVVAARIAACLAVFITKADPMGLATGGASKKDPSTGKRLTSIEPGMIGHLSPNEGIETVDPKRPGDVFPAFVETMMRVIGLPLGLPYELISKDFSKTNYSSARASLLEGRRVFKTWRYWFSSKFCQPLWALVIEEAYLRGMIDISDFYENQAEYTRALWIGGGWGWVDPVKEIQASKDAVDFGFSTMSDEVAGQGRHWEEVLDQRKREQDYIEEIGLKVPEKNKTQEVKDDGNEATEKKEN